MSSGVSKVFSKQSLHILSTVLLFTLSSCVSVWYWINCKKDAASKRTFTFLLSIFSLAETGQATVSPIVTVPSR
jgi:hypothetical protein